MPEKRSVDYSQFYQRNQTAQNKPEKRTKSYPSSNSTKRFRIIAILSIVLCFCATLLIYDSLVDGYALGDFDTANSSQKSIYYCVQTGCYLDKSTAEYYARTVQSRGGAGYVLYDGNYRVIASVYLDRDKAQTVADRLSSTHEECSVYTLTLSKIYDNSLPSSSREIIENCTSYADFVYRELYEISNGIDQEIITSNELTARLENLKSTLAFYSSSLESISFSTPSSILLSNIKATLVELNKLPPSPTSASLRYLYVFVLSSYNFV